MQEVVAVDEQERLLQLRGHIVGIEICKQGGDVFCVECKLTAALLRLHCGVRIGVVFLVLRCIGVGDDSLRHQICDRPEVVVVCFQEVAQRRILTQFIRLLVKAEGVEIQRILALIQIGEVCERAGLHTADRHAVVYRHDVGIAPVCRKEVGGKFFVVLVGSKVVDIERNAEPEIGKQTVDVGFRNIEHRDGIGQRVDVGLLLRGQLLFLCFQLPGCAVLILHGLVVAVKDFFERIPSCELRLVERAKQGVECGVGGPHLVPSVIR